MDNLVIRHPYADGLAFRVHQPARYFRGCLEQKRIGTGCEHFHHSVTGIADFRVGTDFRQVTADQGEVVFVIELADALDSLHRRFIADMATQCVARIGGVNHQPAPVDDRDRLLNQAPLRVVGMNFEELGHGKRF